MKLSYQYPELSCTKNELVTQGMWSCETCGIETRGICEACARTCHRGHKLTYKGVTAEKCACKSYGCFFARVDAQWDVVNKTRQWVCVCQDGEKNRVFVSEQVDDFSAKDFGDVLGLKKNERLAVVCGNQQRLLKPDTPVLQKFPELKLQDRPEEYDSLSRCLRIVPEETNEFVLFIEVEAVNPEIKGRALPRISVEMKECERNKMTGGELVQYAKGEVSNGCKQCDLYVKKADSDDWSKIDKDMEIRGLLLDEKVTWQVRCELEEEEVQSVKRWVQIMEDIGANEVTVISYLNEIGQWYRENVGPDSNNAPIFKGFEEMRKAHQLLRMVLYQEMQSLKVHPCLGLVFNKYWHRDIDRQFMANLDSMIQLVDPKNSVKSSLFKKKKKEPNPSLKPFLSLMELYGLRGESGDKGVYLRLFEDLYKYIPKRSRDRPFIRKTLIALIEFKQALQPNAQSSGPEILNLFDAPAEILHMPLLGEAVMDTEE